MNRENEVAASYTLSIKADSGYESEQTGRCSAAQYGAAVRALSALDAQGGEAVASPAKLCSLSDELDRISRSLQKHADGWKARNALTEFVAMESFAEQVRRIRLNLRAEADRCAEKIPAFSPPSSPSPSPAAVQAHGEKTDHCYKCGDYVAPMDRVSVNIMMCAAGSVPSVMKLHCSKCAPSFGVRQHGDSGLTGSVPKDSTVQALRDALKELRDNVGMILPAEKYKSILARIDAILKEQP